MTRAESLKAKFKESFPFTSMLVIKEAVEIAKTHYSDLFTKEQVHAIVIADREDAVKLARTGDDSNASFVWINSNLVTNRPLPTI